MSRETEKFNKEFQKLINEHTKGVKNKKEL